jgi:hypothetical protein
VVDVEVLVRVEDDVVEDEEVVVELAAWYNKKVLATAQRSESVYQQCHC